MRDRDGCSEHESAPHALHRGAVAELVRSIDWSATSLGPTEDWAPVLRNAVNVILASKAQIVMFWGDDYVAVYNDGYAPTIGRKHPRALGRPAAENWAELWETLEPLLALVRSSGEAFAAKDYPFQIDRAGFVEDVYFDISYDPVRVEDGSIGGVLCIVSETTTRVLIERRLALLSEIDSNLIEATDVAGVLRGLSDALGERRPDIPFVRLMLAQHSLQAEPLVAEIGEVPAGLGPCDFTGAVTGTELRLDGAVVGLGLPLRSAGAELGWVLLGTNRRYEPDQPYRQFLRLVGERLAAAIGNAQLFEAEHRVAVTLQRAILPPVLQDLPRVRLACTYLPATQGLDVGGDWYDALALAGDQVALVIGDVAGKGLTAAALMGQLRHALRAYLLDGHGPAAALDRLNRLVWNTEIKHSFATALVAVLDTVAMRLRWCSAGHLPPLVIAANGAAGYLQDAPGQPVGVQLDSYAEQCAQLRAGATLVLYTDGLVENRHEDVDTGLARACALASAFNDPNEVVPRLLQMRPPDRRQDDIAIIAAQLSG